MNFTREDILSVYHKMMNFCITNKPIDDDAARWNAAVAFGIDVTINEFLGKLEEAEE